MGVLRNIASYALRQIPLVREFEQRQLAAEKMALRYRAQASGVKITMGRYETEINEAMRGSKKWDSIARMEADPHVKGALRFNSLPLLAAEWVIVPASEDKRDQDIAEFVAANLLCQSGETYGQEYWLQTSWRQRLFEILDMLSSGFSMFAKTTRRVGSRVVYDRMAWLEPASVDPHGWMLDDEDRITRVVRTYQTPTMSYRVREALAAEQICLYVWELKGARYEGTSFIRSMWGPWFRKDAILRYSAIAAQKFGSPVPMGIYPPSWSTQQDVLDNWTEFVESLRGTSPTEAVFVGPAGDTPELPKVSYAGLEVENVDRLRGLIDGENAEIAHAGGTKAMLLGETATGAKAVAEPISAIELMFLRAIATAIEEFANIGAANLKGEVQELVDWNYGGVQRYPRLKCANVHPAERLSKMPGLIAAVGAGIVPKHPELRKQVTELYGFHLPDDAYEPEPIPGIRPGGNGGFEGGQAGEDIEGENGNGKSAEERALSLASYRQRVEDLLRPAEEDAPAKGARFRRRTVLEAKHVNLAAVQESFDKGDRDLLLVLRDTHWRMLEEIMRRVASGKINARNLESQRRSKFRGVEKASQAITKALEDVGERGSDHASQEITSQTEAGRDAA
jgi:hypothetical protein